MVVKTLIVNIKSLTIASHTTPSASYKIFIMELMAFLVENYI